MVTCSVKTKLKGHVVFNEVDEARLTRKSHKKIIEKLKHGAVKETLTPMALLIIKYMKEYNLKV